MFGSLRVVLGPSCRRLGTILEPCWGYFHQLGQPRRHFGLTVGQLGSILTSKEPSSRMRMNGADLQGALQPGPVVLPRRILVPFGPYWGQLGPLWNHLWPSGGVFLPFLALVRLWAIRQWSRIFFTPSWGHLGACNGPQAALAIFMTGPQRCSGLQH